jgi:hypothetical protein
VWDMGDNGSMLIEPEMQNAISWEVAGTDPTKASLSLDLDNFLDIVRPVELDHYLPQASPMQQDLASLCLPGVIGHFDHIDVYITQLYTGV